MLCETYIFEHHHTDEQKRVQYLHHPHIQHTYLQTAIHQGQEIRGTESVRQMGAFCSEEALTILTQHVLELRVLVESAEHTAQPREDLRLVRLFVADVYKCK